MRTINIDLNAVDKTIYYDTIIREGEHNASQLVITLSDEFIGYTYKLSFKLNGNSTYLTNDVVPVDGIITYNITNALTHERGTLKCELQAYTGNDYLAKSVIIPLRVQSALEGIPIELPEDYETYIQVVNHYMDKDIYDPQGIQADAFSMDNMIEGANSKIMTSAERQKLALIGGGTTDVEYVDLDITPTSDGFHRGRIQWSEENSTATIGLGDVKIEVNQAQFFRAKNVGATTLNIGQVVAINGTDGGIPTVIMADANGTDQESYAVAVTSIQPVGAGEYGFFLSNGVVHKVDTLGFAEGEALWLSNVNGLLTNVKPSLPSKSIFVGWCIKQGNADVGMVYVNIQRYQNADGIGVLDSANYFTGSNVETILGEIGANIKRAYGEIYVYNNMTSQSIPVNTSVHTKLTVPMSAGESLNCTADNVNNSLVIGESGKYKVDFSFSSQVDTNNTTIFTALFKNGVEVQKAHLVRTASINVPSTGSMSCIMDCTVGDILDIRVRHDKTSPVGVIVRYGNFNIEKI